MDLAGLVERSVPYESRPVPIDPRLRMCAYWGMALMAALMAWLLVGQSVTSTKPGFFIFGYGSVVTAFQFDGHAVVVMILAAMGVAGGAGLAAYTDGFEHAPEWGVYATFALAFGRVLAALPILWTIAVCLLNLALWILFGVLIAIGICIGMWALLVGIFDS